MTINAHVPAVDSDELRQDCDDQCVHVRYKAADYMDKLELFVNALLHCLENDDEWDADTMDEVGRLCILHGFAETGEDGYFRRKVDGV